MSSSMDLLSLSTLLSNKRTIKTRSVTIIAGGEGGIRTHGTLAGTTVFKTVAFNHSATSPKPGRVLRLAQNTGFGYSCGVLARPSLGMRKHASSFCAAGIDNETLPVS